MLLFARVAFVCRLQFFTYDNVMRKCGVRRVMKGILLKRCFTNSEENRHQAPSRLLFDFWDVIICTIVFV